MNPKQKPAKPVTVTGDQPQEVIAQAIIDLSDGVRKLLSGRLTKRAIIILLNKSSDVSFTSIERVLDALESLKKDYTR